jgi:DNA modification methylase
MPVPFQLALDFHESQPATDLPDGIAIDESFPEDLANELAVLESYNKHLYRPNTYLHKWWARRSGTTFRHILKQLVNNPGKRDFYEGRGLEGKIIFDPMIGGGTTLHEAIRMGANVIGVDIDPIPVLQTKASLNQSSLKHKGDVFNLFMETLKDKLARFYKTACPICNGESETQFLLYGLRKACACREAIFIDSLLLRKSNDHEIFICPECHDVYTNKRHTCRRNRTTPLMIRGSRRCEKCNSLFADILSEPFTERYIPIVNVGLCQEHGTFFKSIASDDIALNNQALLNAKEIGFGDLHTFAVPDGPKSKDLLRRGINNFLELFTPRQLIYLDTASEFLSELHNEDRIWLALLISTSLEFNSLLCGYKGGDIRRPGAIRHVFSYHAYSFPYTALENNPIFSGNTSGTLNRLFNDRIIRAGQWAISPFETKIYDGNKVKIRIKSEIDAGEPTSDWKAFKEGERKFAIFQGDAASIDIPKDIADFVVTDPPYYDSVQYSDLSNFFRVWLSRFLPDDAQWHYNPVESAVSQGNGLDGHKYCTALSGIWKNCFRTLNKKHGRLIFTFHHWRPDAWAELTLSLRNTSFFLVNRYVVFSENPISVHIKGLNALKHDTILVLKPRDAKASLREWPRPSNIDTQDSYTFCRDCGSALGWFLNSTVSEDNVYIGWKQLIAGNSNGKTSG